MTSALAVYRVLCVVFSVVVHGTWHTHTANYATCSNHWNNFSCQNCDEFWHFFCQSVFWREYSHFEWWKSQLIFFPLHERGGSCANANDIDVSGSQRHFEAVHSNRVKFFRLQSSDLEVKIELPRRCFFPQLLLFGVAPVYWFSSVVRRFERIRDSSCSTNT